MAGIPGSGGKKGRSGRKSKAVEMGLVPLLDAAFPQSDREEVLRNLANIAKSCSDPKAAVSAASLLLGYTYGKPTEKHEHGGKDGGAIQIIVNHVKRSSATPG